MEPSSFLASIARFIGDAALAEKHEALKQEASLPDLPEELADDEDSDDDGPWEYDWCPTAEVRRDDLEGAVAARYDDSGDGLDAVAHFAARLAVACGPVAGARRSVARFFLDRETARYRRRLARGRTRLDAAAAAGSAAPSSRAATAAARAYLSRRFPRAASWREARADASFLRDCAGAVGAVVFVRGAAVFGDAPHPTDRGVELAATAMKRRGAQWRAAKTLVIDEISMVDGALLDTLDEVARRVRGNSKPFGGLQLILCGDFYQLPPVTKGGAAQIRADETMSRRVIESYRLMLRFYGLRLADERTNHKDDFFVLETARERLPHIGVVTEKSAEWWLTAAAREPRYTYYCKSDDDTLVHHDRLEVVLRQLEREMPGRAVYFGHMKWRGWEPHHLSLIHI